MLSSPTRAHLAPVHSGHSGHSVSWAHRALRVLGVLALGTLGAPAGAQPRTDEGPLANDAFQPTDLPAEEAFVTGRSLVREARRLATEGDPGAAARLSQGFESWRLALARSDAGAGLRLDPTDPDGRLVVGVEEAVRLELERLDPAERGAWIARFEDLATAAATGGASDLRIERTYPGTLAAIRAALRLADAALEAGQPAAAATWCQRAEAHLAGRDRATDPRPAALPGAGEAIARRHALALQLQTEADFPELTAGLPPVWEAARHLPNPTSLAFEFESDPTEDGPYFGDLFDRPSRVDAERGPGRGVRLGMVATGPDSIAIQSAAGVHLVDLAGKTPRRDLVIDPKRLVEEVFGRVGRARAARRDGAPGWGQEPRVADGALLLVVGRTQAGRGPNSLLRIDLDSLAPREADPLAARLESSDRSEPRWILSGARLWSGGEYRDHPLLDELEGAELQPGPVVFGDRVIVSARTLDGELRHHLIALDLATGEPLWTRLVAKGSEVTDQGGGRFSQGGFPMGAAPPLVLADGRVFVGTHLGVGALYDAVDGRLLWSFKNRRRTPGEPGWSGLVPLVTPASTATGEGATIVWAPADSDRLYQLLAGPLTAEGLDGGQQPGQPMVAAPLASGEATDLVASDGTAHLCFARAGGERCLALIDPQRGTRTDSVYLRRGEVFVDRPAVGSERVIAASNRGLFLFDRADELRLLDQLPLPFGRGPRAPGGRVMSLGQRLLVLGPGTLWVLAPSPPK